MVEPLRWGLERLFNLIGFDLPLLEHFTIECMGPYDRILSCPDRLKTFYDSRHV